MLAFLAAVTIRSLILAVLAALAVVRLKSPATRHAVWTLVTAGMLTLAVAIVVLPAMPVHVVGWASGWASGRASRPAHREIAAPFTIGAAPLIAPVIAPPPAQPFPWEQASVVVYCAGFLIFAARLAYGYRLTRKLVQSSRTIARFEHDSVYESEHISVPLTVGCLRPKILLPRGWDAWEPEKLEAVLVHERSHVRRRDWAVAVLAGINRCVFWLHPLAWWLEARLNVLAEQACDDASLPHVASRECYAQVLVEMAAAVRAGGGRVCWQAMAMAKGAEVRMRVERILDVNRQICPAMTRGRWRWMAVCAVPVVYLAAVARPARLRAQDPTPTPAPMTQSAQEPQPAPHKPASQGDSELEAVRAELSRLEAQIATFKSGNTGRFPEPFQANVAQLTSLEAQLAGANEALSGYRQQRRMLETQLQNLKAQVSSYNSSPTSSADVERLKVLDERIQYLRSQLEAAKATYTPQHPSIRRLEEFLDLAEKQRSSMGPPDNSRNQKMLLDLQGSINMIETDMQHLNLSMVEKLKQVQELNLMIAQYQQRMENAPQLASRYAAISREYTAAQQRLEGMLNRPNVSASGPRLISRRDPGYTPEARKAGLQGKVELSVTIGTDGVPRDIRVTRGLGTGLDQQAVQCVKAWRFSPASRNGQPVTAFASVEVAFHLP